MKNRNSNYQRLTVTLNNLEKKKDFQTTYTYKPSPTKTPITSIQDAVNVVLALHSETTDSPADIARKIKKVTFSGKVITQFTSGIQTTKNGWIAK